MLKIVLVSSLVLMSAAAQAAPVATNASGIVAVVGEEAITSYDVMERLKFVFATTKIGSNPEAVSRLTPQIVRALIDEHLQLQEGRKNDITLFDKELDQAIAAIENQRGIPAGGIRQMMAANRIAEETFTNQVKAQIVWSKLLQKKVRSQVKISDEEVAQMIEKLSRPEIKQEIKIGLWQLSVDKKEREKEVARAAEKFVMEVRNGANFEELARQFAGGSAGITTFWVRPEQLDPAIARAIVGAKAGYVSDPLRNQLGFTIIKVYETRDLPGQAPTGTEITFKEITLKLRSSADEKEINALRTIAEEVAKHPGTCAEKNIAGIENAELASISVDKTTQMLSDLPAALRVIADGMKVGDISSPLAGDEGVKLYMLCGKREGVKAVVDKERARGVVYQQRMELEAQKYMRNLRRDAFIEIRNPS